MKSLVIGGAGFVGAYLINHLKNELQHEVVVTKMQHEFLDNQNVKVLDMDILDKVRIKQVLDEIKPDYIFHLAAQSSVALSWKNPTLTIDVNIKGTVNLLDVIREMDNKPRILLIGSGEEYGRIRSDETPIVEENVLRPGNIYAATKACQNMIGKIYADAYNLDIMMVRAFNHTGPNQAPIFVVADFCKQVAEIEAGLKQPILEVGNLSAKRDFTDVRDVVRAYGLLISKGEKGQTYNVGSGQAVAIEQILEMIISMAKVEIKIEVDVAKLRPIDVPIIEADISKLIDCTGWSQSIELSQTISETLEYYRKQVKS